ncbi:MAG: hypothetical protein KIT09_14010 [Bryobacteraceae bacterium]|nr:hypothetical protein [Bryobacteraceae bacterium]
MSRSSAGSSRALALACLIAEALAAGCKPGPAEPATIDEASGVAYHDGDLYIVDDSVNGAYFRIPLKGRIFGPVIPLNDMKPIRVELPEVGIWIDLEGIDFLADGRIVLLSERLHSLVGEEGLIAEYDYPLGEIGRRGLEGVAVRPAPEGASRIAVIWEGGYPERGSLHPLLEERVGGSAFRPLIFVHDLRPGERVGRIPMASGTTAVLDVPMPEGSEPDAQRFRAPDLVWYRWPGEPEKWGYIVLISSQNGVEKPQYLNHWLQRFGADGKPAGDHINIAEQVPGNISHANWEGLGWFTPGKSLVLVHEGTRTVGPHAFILELPPDWQTDM